MKIRYFLGFALVCIVCGRANAQGMMPDVMSGKLVNPTVGDFAWYTLHDTVANKQYYLRQAIVGEERVKRKDGYWLETELVPSVGFPSVYKMLLTGPANKPENVHRLLVREGNGLVQEVGVDQSSGGDDEKEAPRESTGIETVTYPGGTVDAEHYVIKDGDATTELWMSDQVPPMGLVRMKTPQGELMLQRFGNGGKDGESLIPTPTATGGNEDKKREEGKGSKAAKDEKPGTQAHTNFGGRRRGR